MALADVIKSKTGLTGGKNTQVLLLGGLGCGKTTLLSSMMYQCRGKELYNHLVVSEVRDIYRPLYEKIYSLNKALSNIVGDTFMMDFGIDSCVSEYTLNYSLPGRSKGDSVTFIDIPGSFLLSFNNRKELDFESYVEGSDVIVIVVDTPYLMEASTAVADYWNCINYIHILLSYINDSERKGGHMVVFAPVKCEKWVKEGRLDEVVEKVKKAYTSSLEMLCRYKKINICILPVETAGGISFSEFREPYRVRTESFESMCCLASKSAVWLPDGTPYWLKEGDVVEQDPRFCIYGTNLTRPCAWFRASQNSEKNPSYNPHNCEQLLLHILSFITQNRRFTQEQNRHMKYFFPPRKWGITLEEMESLMGRIRQAGLLKDRVEGIEYIKKSF